MCALFVLSACLGVCAASVCCLVAVSAVQHSVGAQDMVYACLQLLPPCTPASLLLFAVGPPQGPDRLALAEFLVLLAMWVEMTAVE